VLLPLLVLACGLLVPLRKAVAAWASQYTDTPAEAELSAAQALKEQLDQQVRQGSLTEETEAAKARLRLEAAQLETDAEAARQCLPQAVEARQVALEARGRAEAEAAPELARRNSDAEVLQVLKDAYAVFCREYGWSDVPMFGTWISGFNWKDVRKENR
jgi:exonuclease VII large subunit